MQGKTEADITFFKMPMQSPFAKGGYSLHPTVDILKTDSLCCQIQVPFENTPPRATTSGSLSSTKYS